MYIITSKTRSKMKRNPSDLAKMKEDVRFKCKAAGLAELVPLKNQDPEQMTKDLSKAGHFFQEEMQAKREKRRQLKIGNQIEKQRKRMQAAPELAMKRKKQNP